MRVTVLVLVSCLEIAACASSGDARSIAEGDLRSELRAADQALREARLTDAEIRYRRLTEEHPEISEAWLRLGNVYTRQAQLEAAIRVYQEGLRYGRTDGRIWYNLAIAQLKQAVDTLEASSAVLPEDSPYRPRIRALHESLLRGVPQSSDEVAQ